MRLLALSTLTENMGIDAEFFRNQAEIPVGQKQCFQPRYLNWHQFWLDALVQDPLTKERGWVKISIVFV